ncbi:MarR family winged helix-turn-helix transcriptional regulator [Leifsonia sp. TF02-11]|uniref:MarR family winged helix-turn-helix transcriptional regulator n=1 Tax=Leifsonia sp. TF02-11 TaxID=2815212 RepID=UPI001AA15853|nr:MarR family transcriptional regulator [Leifsonia sp. TF02-11]MBO1741718.1 MarR family transcriptional regulator [Leifsonia sp. TF02-11]
MNEPVDISARWRELQGLYLSTAAELERTLQQGHQLGLSEYEVLDLVAGYANESCTMRNLVDLTPMTQSALSRIVERLVKAGLVERNTCDYDRRALFVGITAEGARVHDDAKRAYEGMLEKALAGAGVPA